MSEKYQVLMLSQSFMSSKHQVVPVVPDVSRRKDAVYHHGWAQSRGEFKEVGWALEDYRGRSFSEAVETVIFGEMYK